MHRLSFLFIIAITLSSGFAVYNTSNYNKSPQTVASDSDMNFVNSTMLTLNSNNGDLYLTALNLTSVQANASLNTWKLWLRQVNTDSLGIGDNSSAVLNLPLGVNILQDYAYSILTEIDDIPQLRVYQQPLRGGAPIPRIQFTNNQNTSFIPLILATVPIQQTVYVFYLASDRVVNVTNFRIGGSIETREFTLTSNYISSISVTSGEALGSNSVYALWLESVLGSAVLKEAVVDVTKGAFTPVNVTGYLPDFNYFKAFSTDRKVYGGIFVLPIRDINLYYIKSNINSSITYFTKASYDTKLINIYPYGEYFVLFWEQQSQYYLTKTVSYEIWREDATGTYQPKTDIITFDYLSAHFECLVPEKGIYSLLYNNRPFMGDSLTSIMVGQVLSGSILSLLAGFLMAAMGLILLI
jgi:hypothetical protein